jgi:hypothetical protein
VDVIRSRDVTDIIVGDLTFFTAFTQIASSYYAARGVRQSPPADVFAAAEYLDAWQALKAELDPPTGSRSDSTRRRTCGATASS